MKRLLSVLTVSALLAAMLTGCGGSKQADTGDAQGDNSGAQSETSEKVETRYLTLSAVASSSGKMLALPGTVMAQPFHSSQVSIGFIKIGCNAL